MPLSGEKVIVVGAGPAGLAAAGCLKQRGISSLVIEASSQIGSAWRGHYERLHLHTHKGGSYLPGLRFPKDYPRYPSREQVVAYLEQYAKTFSIEPELDERVTRIAPQDGGWAVTTAKRSLSAPHVVVATGFTRVPLQASFPGLEGFKGEVLHSSRYKNGEPWRGKRVLVVGFGNSGGEIAIDLYEHGAQPSLAVRSAVNVIPRELFGVPILLSGAMFRPLPPRVADVMAAPLLKLAIGDFTKLGLRKSPIGPMEQIRTQGRIPLIDVGTLALAREGKLKILPGLQRFTGHSVVFDDGSEHAFDAVVLATGYRPGLDEFLPLATELCDANGYPRSEGEVRPGLHLCGFTLSRRGMLKEIGIVAKATAQRIAAALA